MKTWGADWISREDDCASRLLPIAEKSINRITSTFFTFHKLHISAFSPLFSHINRRQTSKLCSVDDGIEFYALRMLLCLLSLALIGFNGRTKSMVLSKNNNRKRLWSGAGWQKFSVCWGMDWVVEHISGLNDGKSFRVWSLRCEWTTVAGISINFLHSHFLGATNSRNLQAN
jgi:hypothetical protein